MRRTRPAAIAAILGALMLPYGSGAADHGDQPLGLDVLAGLGLAEGPPYPGLPVEMAVEIRQQRPAPILPAGRLLLALFAARDETGAPTPLTGTAVDDGDPFGEAGDVVSMEVSFVPPTPGDEYQGGVVHWKLRPESDPGDAVRFEFSNAAPATLDVELFFEQYLRVELRDVVSNALLDTLRLRMRVELAPGQDLAFEQLSVFPPDAGGEVGVSFELARLGAGAFDPTEPLFVLSLRSEEIETTPALPALAVALLGAVFIAAGWVALGRFR